MSHQINLCNPVLRKRREWLSLQNVVGVVAAVAVIQVGAVAYFTWQVRTLEIVKQEVDGQLKVLQQDTVALGTSLRERKANPALAKDIEVASAAVSRREEALRILATGIGSSSGITDNMRGFARQSIDGVWLTGFDIGQGAIEIHGRLLEASLLPVYIRRLNAEPAFRGRRFEALNMKMSEPQSDKGQASAASSATGVQPQKFLDFSLQSSRQSVATRSETGN